MDKTRRTGEFDFWRAGAAPVRPVRAIKGREGNEQSAKEVKKSTTKEKRTVRFSEGDEQRKGRGDGHEMRRDQEQYQEAARADTDGERDAREDADRRDSRDTGGSSARDETLPGAPNEDRGEEDKEEMDEGRTPVAMTVP